METWQIELKEMIKDVPTLLQLLGLEMLEAMPSLDFPLRVTRSFVDRMQKGNPHDPLLKQVLPLSLESETIEGFIVHPTQDHAFNIKPRLLHKYHGRVLVILTIACAIHCRYCFRRNFDYKSQMQADYHDVLAYIQQHPEIKEVILSGGDPLMMPTPVLESWIQALAAIPHLAVIRIHSRLPIVLPSRMNDRLCQLFQNRRFRWVLVVHCNHPQEINEEVRAVCQKLSALPLTLLNQSVLLRGVNDEVSILTQLSWALFDAGVLPYYLHILDPVAGSAHFNVSLIQGKEFYYQMRAQLPGYLVPLLVQEQAYQPYKTPIL